MLTKNGNVNKSWKCKQTVENVKKNEIVYKTWKYIKTKSKQ